MLSYFRIFFRQFKSNRFFTTIKIVSLAIGFTVCLVLLSLVLENLGYDQFWKGEDQLYRISMEQYQEGQLSFRSARSYRGMPGLLVEEFPEVTARTRLMPDVITVFVGEQQIQDVRMFYADTNVFEVLPREILAAESADVFPDIHSMAISASLARILYGTVDCLGEELRLNEGWTFYISTVFEDIPRKSHLAFDILMSRASLFYYMRNFDNTTGQLLDNEEFEYVDPGPYHRSQWNNRRGYNYLRIKKGTDMEHLLEKSRERIAQVELPERFDDVSIIPDFQAVEEIHLHSDYPDEIKENSSMFHIYMLLLIGLVVLVISWINFINLYAVVFHERIRVVAIRMIHGAGHREISMETFIMGFMLSIVAGALSIGLALVVDKFSQAFSFDATLLLILLFLVLVSGLLAMLIPLSSFRSGRIISQLKGEVLGKRKGSAYRRIMVVAQFSAGLVLIACTLIIYFQMNFTRNKDLGFEDKDIVYSFSPMTMNQRPDIPQKLAMFRNEMEAIPGVSEFCVSSSVPGRPVHFAGVSVTHLKEGSQSEAFIQRINVDPYYFDLYGISMLAGREFREDEHYNIDEIILNREACENLGFEEAILAIGEMITMGENTFRVVGVVENYHHLSLKDKLLPMAFFKSLQWRAAVGYYSFRLSSIDAQTLEQIAGVWTRIYPGEQFLYKFMEESYEEQYRAERSFGTSFMLAALLAIITSCLGLLGLSRFNILKRTKEIGIRLTFGSSPFLVLRLLQTENIVMVLLSSLIGIPLSWVIVRRWLDNFSYRIDPAWWMFFLAFLMVMIVAVLTTLIQTWRASRMNPVDALHYE
ncbi:MAG: ABC transporter permease [Bacteroides sp.]|nr:ABC transporter permease [Bacteroides sp.]